jgi:hypothetical protein
MFGLALARASMARIKPGFDAPHPWWADWGLVAAPLAAIPLDVTGNRWSAVLAFIILFAIWAIPTTVWRRRHRI